MKVKAFYCDARDGRPESEVKTRHGAVMPRDDLQVSIIDRTSRPAVIYGELPDGVEIDGKSVTEISAEEHDNAVKKVKDRYIQARLQHLARVRYEREVSGITVDGKPLHTDRESQANLTAARTKAKDGKPPQTWKLSDGSFMDIEDAEYMIAVADAVFDYVDECFKTERNKAAQIVDGERVELDEGWPSADVEVS